MTDQNQTLGYAYVVAGAMGKVLGVHPMLAQAVGVPVCLAAWAESMQLCSQSLSFMLAFSLKSCWVTMQTVVAFLWGWQTAGLVQTMTLTEIFPYLRLNTYT